MKKEHISDALNMLNDDIIEETNNVRTNAKPKRRWERQIAAVACICLIVVGVFAWRNFLTIRTPPQKLPCPTKE